jgi:hypothetical protein
VSNPNKAKGTAWETAITRALNAFVGGLYGVRAYRPAQSGAQDTGDVHGVSPFVVQAKDDKSHRFSEWLDDVEAQARRAREPFGVVIVKRRRLSVGRAYAVVSFATWVRLLLRLRRAESFLERHAPDHFLIHAQATAVDMEREFPGPGEP